MLKLKDCLPIPARLRFYYAFTYPYLTYNVRAWGSAYKVNLYRLVGQHKRTIRVLVDVPYLAHTTALFTNLNLFKFNNIYTFQVAVYMLNDHDINTRNINKC